MAAGTTLDRVGDTDGQPFASVGQALAMAILLHRIDTSATERQPRDVTRHA